MLITNVNDLSRVGFADMVNLDGCWLVLFHVATRYHVPTVSISSRTASSSSIIRCYHFGSKPIKIFSWLGPLLLLITAFRENRINFLCKTRHVPSTSCSASLFSFYRDRSFGGPAVARRKKIPFRQTGP